MYSYFCWPKFLPASKINIGHIFIQSMVITLCGAFKIYTKQHYISNTYLHFSKPWVSLSFAFSIMDGGWGLGCCIQTCFNFIFKPNFYDWIELPKDIYRSEICVCYGINNAAIVFTLFWFHDVSNPMNQLKLKVNTCSRCKVRENMRTQNPHLCTTFQF